MCISWLLPVLKWFSLYFKLVEAHCLSTSPSKGRAMVSRIQVVACLVALLSLAQLGCAKITKAQIRKDDRSLILMAEPFGFGPDGRINITVRNFQFRPIWDQDKEKVKKPDFSR